MSDDPNTDNRPAIIRLANKIEREAKSRKVDEKRKWGQLAPLQIPLWNDESWASLYDFARSALFTARKRTARKDFKNHVVASLGHLKIIYTGEELRQRDYDVYLEILNAARGANITPDNPWVPIDAWAMLRSLKWQVNNVGLAELHDTITRLIACKVEITRTSGKKSEPSIFYGGSFLHEHTGQHAQDPTQTARWMVVINTTIAKQLQPGQFMMVDKKVRRTLSSSALGKWLHLFYSSHQNPYPMQIETIKSLAGLEGDETKVFKFNLRAQMDKLVEMNAILSYHIDEKNKLHVLPS